MWKIAHISVAYSSRAVDSGSCSLPRSVRAEVVSCCSPQAVPFSWDFILTSLDSLGIGLATQTQHWGTLKFLSIGMSQLCSPSLRRLSIQLDSFLHRTYLCNLCSLNTPRGFSHASLINIHLPPPEVTETLKSIINPVNGIFLPAYCLPDYSGWNLCSLLLFSV